MQKKRFVTLMILFLLAITVFTADAGLSFIGGAKVSSGSVLGEVKIAGFGNTPTNVSMTVTGSGLTAWCTNRGGNQAPGQNPVSVNASVSQQLNNNGNGTDTLNFHVNILPTPEQAGCPNKNWTVTDLLGTVNINFHAQNANGSADINLVCVVNERNHTIICN